MPDTNRLQLFKKSDNWKKENWKSEKNGKLENWKIVNFLNRKISKPGPNHGAPERPKDEPVAIGDLKASEYYLKDISRD